MKFNERFRGRHLAGLIFLGLQILSIAYARFIPERFFCWAPYDERSKYRIEVQLMGRVLSEDEVATRYRYYPHGWEPRSINNVIAIVRQFERTYGSAENAQVTIWYQTNGHAEQIWKWPES